MAVETHPYAPVSMGVASNRGITKIGEDEVDAYDHRTALNLLRAQNEAPTVSDAYAANS